MALLDIVGLTVSVRTEYGRAAAVRDVSFAVEGGRTMCLVGESGCGKSLTASALLGLLPRGATRSARRMTFDGRDLTDRRQSRGLLGSSIAAVFQDPMTALNPAYTVGDQLTEGMKYHLRLGSTAARERALKLLDRVGVPSPSRRYDQYPHQLSGGLRQRVTIAMALACGPRLLVADEPTTALDVTIQAQVLSLLLDLQRETEIAILLITHDLTVVAQMADEVAVMYAGEIVERGPVAAVLGAPRHPYTAALLRCLPRAGRGLLGTIPGTVPALADLPAGCAFARRCAMAAPACAVPPPVHADGAHLWRCIR